MSTRTMDLKARVSTEREAPPSIRITAARKHFKREDGTLVRAIDGIDLVVPQGEFVVLLGPSGCGKTTLLRSIAGLEDLTDGQIEVQGRVLFDAAKRVNVPPEKRQVGMMFQSYALWPHMTVAQNVGYPLSSQRVARSEIKRRVDEILEVVGISEIRGQYPSQISGGQQQRVALARAQVSGHGVVLFDEPLSNVDARVRDRLRGELKRLHRDLGFTAVYVTHDQDEALALATTVVVLDSGTVAQRGAPREIYEAPVNGYVARFMGSANRIPGTVTEVGADGSPCTISTPLGPLTGRCAHTVTVGQSVTAFIRPERLLVGAERTSGMCWQATAESETFHGFYLDRVFEAGGLRLAVRSLSTSQDAGAPLQDGWLHADPGDVRIVPAEEA